jgi:hypothetical protein
LTRRAERLHCTLQARFRVPIGSGADLALGAQADADAQNKRGPERS